MTPPPQLSLDVFGIEEKPEPKPMTRKEKREQDKIVLQLIYTISPPWIVPPGYEHSINPEWDQKRMVDIMKNHVQIFAKEVSSEFDAMIYISFCTLMAKPSSTAARIYENLFSKFYDYSTISDYPPPELDYQEHEILMKLRSWIFKRQMECVKK